MKNSNGVLSLKKLSKSIERLNLISMIALLGLGFLVVFLHARLRYPMQIHGRHGLEWMALLMLGRLGARQRWSATISSIGAAGFALLPGWGLNDPYISLTFLLPGPAIDLLYHAARRLQNKAWYLSIIGGLAHATKPVLRLGISAVTGWKYGSPKGGLAYPLISHLLFGMIGALIGSGAFLGIRWLIKKQKE
ncbi:MAG: hypothetical protein AB1345_12195 [Chloroflexota bacterium]